MIPFKDNGLCLYGFTNLKSDTIIPARYEHIETIFNKKVQAYYIVQHGTQYGVLDEFGNLIIPEIWSYLTTFYKRNGYNVSFEQTCRGETFLENTYLEGRQSTGFGILKLNGQIVLNPVYQGIRSNTKKLYEVKIKENWGIVDTLGNIVVAPHYQIIEFTNTPNVYLLEEEKEDLPTRRGLIRQNGIVLLPLDFQEISEMSAGFFSTLAVNKDYERGKKSIFHTESGWIYKDLDGITDDFGYKLLHKAGKTTVVDAKTMKPVLSFDCEQVSLTVISSLYVPQIKFSSVVSVCTRTGKVGLYHPATQSWLLPLEYEVLEHLMDSLFAAKRNGIWQIINHRGQIIDNQSFINIGNVKTNTWFTQQKDSILFFSNDSYPSSLHPLDASEYTFIFDNGLLHYKAFDETDVLINRKLKVLNPPHTKIQTLQNGYAIALDTLQKIQILIDSFGKTQPFLSKYEIVDMDISQDVVLVFDPKTHQLGAVRADGSPILPCTYFGLKQLDAQEVLWAKKERSFPITDDDYLIHKRERPDYWAGRLSYLDSAWAMHSKTGQLLTKTVFDFPFQWFDSIGIGQVRGKKGLWRASGENVLPPNYTAIEYDAASEIFFLFETQSIDNQRVGFADARGNLIVDGLFKNISVFRGDYAFVETAAGLGVVRKNGQYLVAPQKAGLQRSSLDLMRLMTLRRDSLENDLLFFANPYDTFFLRDKNILDSLTIDKQIEINNLLLEGIISAHFLQSDRIPYARNLTYQYILDTMGNWRTMRPEMRDHRLTNRDYNVREIHKTDKYLSFWTQFTEISVQVPQHGDDYIFIETLNFERDGQIWRRIGLKDILDLNPSNMGYFTHLFSQKLSGLHDEDIDCSNPSAYFERIQHAFLVLETGLECYITRSGGGYSSGSPSAIQLKFSWAELKPLLKKR